MKLIVPFALLFSTPFLASMADHATSLGQNEHAADGSSLVARDPWQPYHKCSGTTCIATEEEVKCARRVKLIEGQTVIWCVEEPM